MMRRVAIGLLGLWLAAWLGTASAQSGDSHPLAERSGVIHKVDLENQSMVIGGMSYRVAADAEVEIGGSYGAFTMLEPGMRVYFEFLRVSPSERRIVLVRELPPDVELEQV